MANPQVEDGNTRIANDLLEAILKSKFSGSEMSIILAVARKTYGWQKKSDEISIGQFVHLTGLTHRGVCKATLSLVNKKALGREQKGTTHVTSYWIEKDYNKWSLTSEQKGTSEQLFTITSEQTGIQLVNKKAPTKETIQKKIKETPAVMEVFNYFCTVVGKELNITSERKSLIEKRLKEGYTVEQMCQAIDNFSKDTWEGRAQYWDLVYAIGTRKGVNNLDKWLNQQPQEQEITLG